MFEAFSSLLSALAPSLGVPDIALQEEEPVSLLAIDDFEVSLRYLPGSDTVMMFTVVAPLPEKGRNELFASLLDANTFFHGTQGFTLAAREDTGVTLQGVMPMRVLDSANMPVWLQNFVNIAEEWQARCLECDGKAEESSLESFSQSMLRV